MISLIIKVMWTSVNIIEISKLFFQAQRHPSKFSVILIGFINSVVTCVSFCHVNFKTV